MTSNAQSARWLMTFALTIGLPAGTMAQTAQTAQTPQTPQTATQAAPVVAPGDASMDGSRVKMGTLTFKVNAKMNGQEVDLGTMTQEITAMTVDGVPMLRTVQTMAGRMGPSTDTSMVAAKTLVPMKLRGYNPGGSLSVNFAGTKITGEKKDGGGIGHPIEETLAQPVFDSNIIDLLAAALPLKAGYAARLPVYIYEQGGLVWYDVKVTGERDVNGTAAWDVTITMPSGSVRYEISKTDRANLGAEYKAANGMVMIMTRTGG